MASPLPDPEQFGYELCDIETPDSLTIQSGPRLAYERIGTSYITGSRGQGARPRTFTLNVHMPMRTTTRDFEVFDIWCKEGERPVLLLHTHSVFLLLESTDEAYGSNHRDGFVHTRRGEDLIPVRMSMDEAGAWRVTSVDVQEVDLSSAAPSAAWAQAMASEPQYVPITLDVEIGAGIPGGELTEAAGFGATFGAGFSVWVYPNVALRAAVRVEPLRGATHDDDLRFTSFNSGVENFLAGGRSGGATIWHFTGGIEGRIHRPPGSRWSVNGTLGLGGVAPPVARQQFARLDLLQRKRRCGRRLPAP